MLTPINSVIRINIAVNAFLAYHARLCCVVFLQVQELSWTNISQAQVPYGTVRYLSMCDKLLLQPFRKFPGDSAPHDSAAVQQTLLALYLFHNHTTPDNTLPFSYSGLNIRDVNRTDTIIKKTRSYNFTISPSAS